MRIYKYLIAIASLCFSFSLSNAAYLLMKDDDTPLDKSQWIDLQKEIFKDINYEEKYIKDGIKKHFVPDSLIQAYALSTIHSTGMKELDANGYIKRDVPFYSTIHQHSRIIIRTYVAIVEWVTRGWIKK